RSATEPVRIDHVVAALDGLVAAARRDDRAADAGELSAGEIEIRATFAAEVLRVALLELRVVLCAVGHAVAARDAGRGVERAIVGAAQRSPGEPLGLAGCASEPLAVAFLAFVDQTVAAMGELTIAPARAGAEVGIGRPVVAPFAVVLHGVAASWQRGIDAQRVRSVVGIEGSAVALLEPVEHAVAAIG